jgi:hypothetical protein
VDFGQFIENAVSKSLDFLRVAVNDRSAGDLTAARREELAAHRAYQEALYLSTLLRSRISDARARRVAVRIREIEIAMQSV